MCLDIINFTVCSLGKEIGHASKGDMTLYQVTCWGPCHDIGISLRVASGDADLYAR